MPNRPYITALYFCQLGSTVNSGVTWLYDNKCYLQCIVLCVLMGGEAIGWLRRSLIIWCTVCCVPVNCDVCVLSCFWKICGVSRIWLSENVCVNVCVCWENSAVSAACFWMLVLHFCFFFWSWKCSLISCMFLSRNQFNMHRCAFYAYACVRVSYTIEKLQCFLFHHLSRTKTQYLKTWNTLMWILSS